MKIGRSHRGAPHSAMSPGRLTAGARPEIDYVVSPRTRTTHIARSTLARVREPFLFIEAIGFPDRVAPGRGRVRVLSASANIQTTQRTGFCAALGVGNRPHTALIAGLNWFSPQLSRNFLTARVEPGSQSRRDSAERRPCGPFVCSDPPSLLRHVSHDGAARASLPEIFQAKSGN